MTPEGKAFVNDLLGPHGAELVTPIEAGQDELFVKVVTKGASEAPANILAQSSLIYRFGGNAAVSVDAARGGNLPLLRIISMYNHARLDVNVIEFEDMNARW